MYKYRNINIISGWVIFIIATFVYFTTMEPTASWWDCSERITAANGLEIPHPPGAPFFILLGRVFTMLAPDPSKVALFMNAMSALAASFTVMLLFWIITHLGKKIISPASEPSKMQTVTLMGAAYTGSLAFCFSDTQWFIAVEAEAYATSGLFTALVFWSILRWESAADSKFSSKWLILIAYLMGLSIGVHLLNLLVIPAIVFVYYYKMCPVSWKGIFYAGLISLLLLGSLFYVVIPGSLKMAGFFELAMVNYIGLPYHSGVLLFIIVIALSIAYGLYKTHWKRLPVFNTIILGLAMVLTGYSSYALIVIRSNAGPPMDQSSPDNIFSLYSYLTREQYLAGPLLHGQYYSTPVTGVKEGSARYIREKGRYLKTSRRLQYEYPPELTGFFPRMWSSSEHHISEYERWGNIKGRKVRAVIDGQPQFIIRPTFLENIVFFLRYQVWHMYGRYFMWNFVGRQNDNQGLGDLLDGNWLSGVRFIDSWRLGPQDSLPKHIADHPARNIYYGLPLLLGLAGLYYHYRKSKNDFTIIVMLFFFTGLAIIIYLNQYPMQPRERDYTYAGSFMAFSIWIGMGVLALIEWLQKILPKKFSNIGGTIISFILVPGLMAAENLDDHNRSGRFTARDFAINYLNSTEPDSILFTHGDNDTFPLWYAQEVEGIRTDVRVVVLGFLNADWYIGQMKRKMNNSRPLPISIPRHKHVDGTNDQVPVWERTENRIDARQAIDFFIDDSDQSKARVSGNRMIDYLPAGKIGISVDASKVIENATVAEELRDEIVSSVNVDIEDNYLMKNQMIILDILATNKWERPIYFTNGRTADVMGLEDYFQLEGFAYRLVPIQTEGDFLEYGRINASVMYDNFMNKFTWGRMNKPDVHLCYYNLQTISILRLRHKFARLADALTGEKKPGLAIEVLDRCMELMPTDKVKYDIMMFPVIEAYYNAGNTNKANILLEGYFDFVAGELEYFLSFPARLAHRLDYEKRLSFQVMNEIISIGQAFGQHELSDKFRERFEEYIRLI
ncbi:MAG: DUF2723 domain-containing protein [Bacteroidales bacterium]